MLSLDPATMEMAPGGCREEEVAWRRGAARELVVSVRRRRAPVAEGMVSELWFCDHECVEKKSEDVF